MINKIMHLCSLQIQKPFHDYEINTSSIISGNYLDVMDAFDELNDIEDHCFNISCLDEAFVLF